MEPRGVALVLSSLHGVAMSAVTIGAAALLALAGATTRKIRFDEWFQGSQVVDDQGQPLVVYHGTTAYVGPRFAFREQPGSHLGFHFGTARAANDKLISDRESAHRRGPPAVYVFDEDQRTDARTRIFAEERALDKRIKQIHNDILDRNPSPTPGLMDQLFDEGREDEALQLILDNQRRSAPSPQEQMELRGIDERRRALQEELAEAFLRVKPGENIIPVYLNIKRPIVARDANWGDPDAIRRANQHVEEIANMRFRSTAQLRDGLIRLGYDGIKYENKVEDPGSISWIAFSPNQIKSAAGNTGRFSKSNAISLNRR